MTEITEKTACCDSCDIHYLAAGKQEKRAVVLLHGMKFQAETWRELGTLDHLARADFHAAALDMPGFGRSPVCTADPNIVLEPFVRSLSKNKVILVGPSMGGQIALEFTISHPDLVSGLVLIGAVGVEENRNSLASIRVPTLLVWGNEDQISPLANCETLHAAIRGSKKIIIEGASHPCYLDNPDRWHAELAHFLDSLNS